MSFIKLDFMEHNVIMSIERNSMYLPTVDGSFTMLRIASRLLAGWSIKQEIVSD